MTDVELINSIDDLINDIKGSIREAGIDKDSSEFQILTEIFLYKFLNDKFKYEAKKISKKLNVAQDFDKALNELTDTEFDELTINLGSTAIINKNQTISYLYANREYFDGDGHLFDWLFDKTLIDIGKQNIDIFSVLTENNNKITLFDGVCRNIVDERKRTAFAKSVISKLVDAANFEYVFSEKYDFFATVFEHLISEYNSNGGGANAEYYTPTTIAQVIAKILVDEPVQNVEVCDPTAGSGTLLMAIAHEIGEDKCTIYSQDLTQKSVKLLRLNLILNNLTHSLPNVKQADLLEFPQFYNDAKNNLRQFDFIVSNPPFKTNFSSTHDKCLDDRNIRVFDKPILIDGNEVKEQKRFFAGVPNIPPSKKESMAIYLLVIQHILYSLKDTGRAGIVVPTKFLDWTDKIATKIRRYLIDNKWLKAVVSMPSNVFANTGTSVSVLFIDKSKNYNDVFLLDASKLGKESSIKINNKKVKKTILEKSDLSYIIDIIKNRKPDDNSVLKTTDEISKKNHSLVAGQYFEIKLERVNWTEEEFKQRMENYDKELRKLFAESHELEEQILKDLGELK